MHFFCVLFSIQEDERIVLPMTSCSKIEDTATEMISSCEKEQQDSDSDLKAEGPRPEPGMIMQNGPC